MKCDAKTSKQQLSNKFQISMCKSTKQGKQRATSCTNKKVKENNNDNKTKK